MYWKCRMPVDFESQWRWDRRYKNRYISLKNHSYILYDIPLESWDSQQAGPTHNSNQANYRLVIFLIVPDLYAMISSAFLFILAIT